MASIAVVLGGQVGVANVRTADALFLEGYRPREPMGMCYVVGPPFPSRLLIGKSCTGKVAVTKAAHFSTRRWPLHVKLLMPLYSLDGCNTRAAPSVVGAYPIVSATFPLVSSTSKPTGPLCNGHQRCRAGKEGIWDIQFAFWLHLLGRQDGAYTVAGGR